MTVMVDELHEYHHTRHRGWWCHMASDDHTDAGLEELHAMAHKIGLKREWFQNEGGRHPHYDLRPSKRALAVKHGAQQVTRVQLAQRCARDVATKTVQENA